MGNYTFNQSLDDVAFGSLEISGFENLEKFFSNCNLEPNDTVEFSIEYKSKKPWKLLGKPFDISNDPGVHLDVKSKNVEIQDRIHLCQMFGLRMLAKIYDFQRTNLKHNETQLKIELDKDLLCETGIKKQTASIIIVAVCVVALFAVIWIGFFITMKMRKNKENKELHDTADVEH